MFTTDIILGAEPRNNGRRLKREIIILRSKAVVNLSIYNSDPNAKKIMIYGDREMRLPHKSKSKNLLT